MKFEAYINDEDVTRGLRQLRGHCAVAQALARKYPDLRWIRVDRDEIRFTDVAKRVRYTYQTPPDVAQFIDQWDRGSTAARPLLVLPDRMKKSQKAQKARPASDLARPELVNHKTKPAPRKPKVISKRPLIAEN